MSLIRCRNWCVYTHELLVKLGLGEYWIDNSVVNIEHEIWDQMVTKAIQTYDSIEAFHRIQSSGQSKRVYAKLVSGPSMISFTKPEQYLLAANPSPRLRLGCKELIRLRLNSHRLAAEACQWYTDQPPEDGTTIHALSASDRAMCKHCNLNQIEDEYHYLFVCSAYTDYRERLYSQLMRLDLNSADLINSTDHSVRLRMLLGTGYSQLNQAAQSAVKCYLADCAIKRQSLDKSLGVERNNRNVNCNSQVPIRHLTAIVAAG